MGMFDWLGSDPSKKAKKYLEKIPGMIKPYYDPYIEAGNRQLPGLEEQYGQMMNDPGGKLNDIGQGYHQSPGFDFALKQALQGSGNAASAGGMAGSPQHEYQNMETATGLADQDYNSWLSNALGLYGGGLSGSQGLYNQGANSADSLAKMLMENMGQQGSNAAMGAQWKNKMNLGMTGLGLSGAMDMFNQPSGGAGGGGGNALGGGGGSQGGMGGMEKYLPMLLSMI